MIKNVLPVARDVEIGEAVVVVIADGDSHAIVSVTGVRESRFLRDIGEAAVFVLPVQPIPKAWIFAIEAFRQPHGIADPSAIHQEDIKQSIVVVVEEGNASRHGFDQIFLRCRRIAENEIQTMRQFVFKNRERRCSHRQGYTAEKRRDGNNPQDGDDRVAILMERISCSLKDCTS